VSVSLGSMCDRASDSKALTSMHAAELVIRVLPLAVAAAFTPTLLALQLLVVAGENWVRRSIAVAAANALAFALVIGIVLAGLARLPDQGTGHLGPIDRWIRGVCGVILLLSCVFFLWPHPELSRRARSSLERRAASASLWVFFGLACYFSITDLSSFIVLIPALHEVTVSTLAVELKALVVLVVLAVALSTTWLPPTTRAVLGRRITPFLNRLYAFVMTYQFQIVGAVCLAFGLYLTWTGLRGTA
jgi:hypothetical protein